MRNILRDVLTKTLNKMEYIEANDLFLNGEHLPTELTDILETFDIYSFPYEECNRVLELIKPLGYTFDYDLSGEPFNLRKI